MVMDVDCEVNVSETSSVFRFRFQNTSLVSFDHIVIEGS